MPGERTEMRRPAVKMAAAVMPAAEMVAVTMTAAAMATTMMTAAAATTAVAATMATFRDRKVRHGQHRCEDNRGNSQCDL